MHLYCLCTVHALIFVPESMVSDVIAAVSNFTGYATPNQAAIDQGFINKDNLANPAIYPSPDVMKNLKFVVDVGDAQILYDEVFADIKAGVSQ